MTAAQTANDTETLLKATEMIDTLQRKGVGNWSVPQVVRWRKLEPPIPVARHGSGSNPTLYNLDDVLAWLQTHGQRFGLIGDPETSPDGEHVDPRLEQARQIARITRIRADRLERTTLPRDEVLSVWKSAVLSAKTILDQLPEKVAGLVFDLDDYEQTVQILQDEVRDVMARLQEATDGILSDAGPDS